MVVNMPQQRLVSSVEVKIIKKKPDPWKEILNTDNWSKMEDKLIDLVKKYGPDLKGSFKMTIKVNGGYGSNHSTGSTIIITWNGNLHRVWECICSVDQVSGKVF